VTYSYVKSVLPGITYFLPQGCHQIHKKSLLLAIGQLPLTLKRPVNIQGIIYSRINIQGFSDIAKPLHNLMQKQTQFI